MARPKIAVQHFILCTHLGWEGSPGALTKRTLEGVHYRHPFPPDAEAPEYPELWVYVRLFLQNAGAGVRRFWVELSNTRNRSKSISYWPVGTIEFRSDQNVYNEAWAVRPVCFPTHGTYEFRLMYEERIRGARSPLLVARDYLHIET